jgi:putative ABC transport system permease protein
MNRGWLSTAYYYCRGHWALEILLQTFQDVWAHKLRAAWTMFGIAWGIASIVFMMAVGDGFKIGYRNTLYVMGTDIVIIWGGRTTHQAGDQRAGRPIRLKYKDVQRIRFECRAVQDISAEMNRYLAVNSPFNSGRFPVHGIEPVYQAIRSMNLEKGRPLSEDDFQSVRNVCIIGSEVKKQLFADRPAIGAEIRIQGIPFAILGLLEKKDQNNSYNGLDNDKVLIPYSTMARHFPDGRPFLGVGSIDNIIFRPVSADDHERAVRQVRTALGRFHGFKPTDEGALWMWDTIKQARMVGGIFESMQIFLGFIAVITLALGGLGVMNIMLISVAERTREIGVKKAVGAKSRRILLEFFLEALVLTLLSGGSGVLFARMVCNLVSRLPLPTLFAGLPITATTTWLSFGTLVTIGILSAVYPARQAARLTPVEALRYE